MAHPQTLLAPEPLFPCWKRDSEVAALAQEYRQNEPFPHIHLPDFLDPLTAQAIADEFPSPNTAAWTQYKHHNENKMGMAKRELFPPGLRAVADELNSQEFVAWLSQLTGIPGLIRRPQPRGRRPAPVRTRRFPQRPHRFQQPPLSEELAPPRKRDRLPEPRLAGAVGRSD